ncbi:MAG: cytokinesis protein 3 [Pycnora praestabilis]|nr:MAG: cytokinesis protein 3 [Pycnora praestabilis]
MAGNVPSPQKAKSIFRKPFAAYASAPPPNPAASAREIEIKSTGHNPSPSRGPSPAPLDNYRPHSRGPSPTRQNSRAPSPAQPHSYQPHSCGPSPTRRISRAPSPAPLVGYEPYSRAPSPNPYLSRAPSPAPPTNYRPYSRGPSPNPYQDLGSSPPPPAPPPHRVNYNPRAAPSPTPSFYNHHANNYSVSRGPSPVPSSPGLLGHTPPALRNAMQDVMSSLQGMGLPGDPPPQERSRTPIDPWSPEAFGQGFTKTPSNRHTRPRTSLGIGGQENESNHSLDDADEADRPALYRHDSTPPQLSNYVERMESRLRRTQRNSRPQDELFLPDDNRDDSMGPPPAPPPKNSPHPPRPQSSLSRGGPAFGSTDSHRRLRNRKSAYELGREVLGRTFTTKSNSTNASSGVQSTTTNGSSSTQMTSQSVMSGHSAGAFSATSAGSLARRKGVNGFAEERPMSVMSNRPNGFSSLSGRNGSVYNQPDTPLTGITFHSSHDSRPGTASQADWTGSIAESGGILGGLAAPKPKKNGFFKKIIESAKTGAASARSSIAASQTAVPQPLVKSMLPNGVTAIAGGAAARDMGLGGGVDWVQVRRDVNRSNSLSRIERVERAERCQMMDHPAIDPVNALFQSAEGDEGLDGLPIEEPADFQGVVLGQVDKNARFINSLPPMTNPTSLAQGYVCRPYRSDVQRLRAIFTWVSEKVAWEEDFEGEVDSRRVIQTKRGCAEEVAVLVMEMCSALGMHAEVVRGYLKAPGAILDLDSQARPNHWWNAVIVDGAWRIMDCSLASPSNPKRAQYSSAGSQIAETWWFLTRPMEICYTHVPLLPEQQHICPPMPHEVLMALPCASPPYFRNGLQMVDFDTSLLMIEELELVQFQLSVPADIECVAEVEARVFERDTDGDVFENGEVVKKRALAQAEWINGEKNYTIKALLPGDEGQGVLKVYAGKRGLMHSSRDNPHPLAFALPIIHTGDNPPYDFVTRHPTPHAQRHDLYIAQPQCARLAMNNTFVFAIRQHPSSLNAISPTPGAASPLPFYRPSSAMSMSSSSASGSRPANHSQDKPAKLAIQAPSGKILRLMRKNEHTMSTSGLGGGEAADGGVWETIIKIGERGVWRGLVLADRSARWCVFAEWNCV